MGIHMKRTIALEDAIANGMSFRAEAALKCPSCRVTTTVTFPCYGEPMLRLIESGLTITAHCPECGAEVSAPMRWNA